MLFFIENSLLKFLLCSIIQPSIQRKVLALATQEIRNFLSGGIICQITILKTTLHF